MKIATIGSGVIVDRFIEAINLVDSVSLEAIYSRNEERAKSFASKHQVDKYYTDMQTMFNDPEIDTIYIASPNSLHYEQSLQALEAGKNVICEKPFTSTLEETDHLIQVAKANNRFLFEAITTIHLPNYEIVRKELHRLGDVRLVQANFSQYSSKYGAYKEGKHTNVFDPAFSGGALMDINIYNIHFMIGLFGKPKQAIYYPNMGTTNIDTSGVMIMKYDTFVASLTGAKDSSSDFFVSIQGDEASIKVTGLSSGVCKYVDLVPLKGDQIDMNKPENGTTNIGIEQAMHMSYEVKHFHDIVANNDMNACLKLLEHSRDVMDVVYHARINANIKFDADNRK